MNKQIETEMSEDEYYLKLIELERMVNDKMITSKESLKLAAKYQRMSQTPKWVKAFKRLAENRLI